MKTLSSLSLLALALLFLQFKNPDHSKYAEPSLIKKWETDTLLRTPESVLYDDGKDIIYVANINGKSGEKDGNGFISKITTDGKIEKLEWVAGLDAPKGMGLNKNMLYVADITHLIVIDTDLGEIVNSIEVPGAQFLNDVTIDPDGAIYISDSGGKKIFKLENNEVTVWLENAAWVRPNGLLVDKDQLYILDMGANKFYTFSSRDKQIVRTVEGVTKGDGIIMTGKNEFLISNWDGEINYVNAKGEVKKLLDTKDKRINAADIYFIPKQKLVLVPTFLKNSVSAYEFKK